MIIKVQIPVSTNEPEPKALVYSENHVLDVTVPITPKLRRLMGCEFKKFFHAHLENDVVCIDKPADWQEW